MTEKPGRSQHVCRMAFLAQSKTSRCSLRMATFFAAAAPRERTVGKFISSAQVISEKLGRTHNDKIFLITSGDDGKTWGEMSLTDLPNPDSGTDAVTLRDGRQLLVYNHNVRTGSNNKGRSPLNVAVSGDGNNWQAALVLENDPNAPNGFAYPAMIQTSDSLVHITYTWERKRIKHVVIDPAKLSLLPIVDGTWPD